MNLQFPYHPESEIQAFIILIGIFLISFLADYIMEKDIELVNVLYIASIMIPIAIYLNILSFAYIGICLLNISIALFITIKINENGNGG